MQHLHKFHIFLLTGQLILYIPHELNIDDIFQKKLLEHHSNAQLHTPA